ncbi:sugar ABC transporter substrate-binding protein [Agathobaculum sp.]|uniref:sugar ABC transporter substrate-binding protein n=1 Tax=Agathobaculum sp. TaxID=2048138 RepID=UPI002A7F846A|nr:sugar ABC transporter substrate-binding protein [Agathobaculum sp.]MDY3619131.1 sugar ABC transporter substrate-binding protein [Agathobaculum sp.]
MKKRLLAVLLVSAMSLGLLAGCGDDGAQTPGEGGEQATNEGGAAEKYQVGFSIAMRDQFWTSMENAMKPFAEENNIDLSILDANQDVATQLGQVQTWAADGYDAAVIGLANNDSAEDVLAAAGDMKVVFVNRQPNLDVLKDGQVVYVGTDETLYGTEQGNYLAKLFEADGKTEVNIAMFTGTLGLDNVTKRTNSAKAALEANGIKANYVFENTAEWDRGKAMDQFSQFMGTGETVDAVICNNDEMALGVIEAMKTNGDKTVFCPVVGIDATDVGCAAVKAGDMACSVFQDPVAQGEGTLKCALGLIKGEAIDGLVDNYYNITPQLVTKDNVDNFIK